MRRNWDNICFQFIIIASLLIQTSVCWAGKNISSTIITVSRIYCIGAIDNTYNIQLYVDFDNETDNDSGNIRVTGAYFYDNKKSDGKLRLEGTFNINDGSMQLSEYEHSDLPGKQKNTGKFIGLYKKEGTAVGNWFSADGKQHTFYLNTVVRHVNVYNVSKSSIRSATVIIFTDKYLRDVYCRNNKMCGKAQNVIEIKIVPSSAGKSVFNTGEEVIYYSNKLVSIITSKYQYNAGTPHGQYHSGWKIIAENNKSKNRYKYKIINNVSDLITNTPECRSKINDLIRKTLENTADDEHVELDSDIDFLYEVGNIEIGPIALRFKYDPYSLGRGYIYHPTASIKYEKLINCIPKASPLIKMLP